MNIKKINARTLNKKITIQKLTTTPNTNGFPKEEWRTYKTVWASINNLWGKEFWEAKAIQNEKTVEFMVRYSESLELIDSKKYRIYWNNEAYNIIFIDNVKYENKWLKIKAIQ